MRSRLASLNESIQMLGNTKIVQDKLKADIEVIRARTSKIELSFEDQTKRICDLQQDL